MKVESKNFVFDFLEGIPFPNLLMGLEFDVDLTGNDKSTLQFQSINASSHRMSRWNFVPEYIKPKLKPGYTYKKFDTAKGFGVLLGQELNAQNYIQKKIKSRLRTSLRKNIRNLEQDFEIRYRIYFGEISDRSYSFLMEALHDMIMERFNQRGQEHQRSKHWQELNKKYLPLIRQGRASIYVIYAGDQPIAISLNRHVGPVFSYAVPSFDTNFASYGLGHIVIYKLLEWSISNNYLLFDLGIGEMRYKRDWSNYVYNSQVWFIWQKSDFVASILSKLMISKMRFRRSIKRTMFYKLYLGVLKSRLRVLYL